MQRLDGPKERNRMAENNNNNGNNGSKHIVLAALVALTSSVVWVLPAPSITASLGGAFAILPKTIVLLFAFSVFLAVLAVTAMSAAPMLMVGAALFASSLALLLFKGFSTTALIAAAGFFISMIAYSRSVRSESRERIHASPFKCSSTGYGGAIFIFAVALSVAAYMGAQGMTQFPIPQAAVELSVSPLLSTVGCSSGSTLDACVGVIADKQITGLRQRCNGDAACEALVDRQIASQKTYIVDQTKAKLAESLGIDQNSTEKLSTLLGSEVRKKIDEMLAPYRAYIAPLMALTVFTALSTVSVLVRFPVLLFSALFFAVFRMFGIIRLSRENREVEIID